MRRAVSIFLLVNIVLVALFLVWLMPAMQEYASTRAAIANRKNQYAIMQRHYAAYDYNRALLAELETGRRLLLQTEVPDMLAEIEQIAQELNITAHTFMVSEPAHDPWAYDVASVTTRIIYEGTPDDILLFLQKISEMPIAIIAADIQWQESGTARLDLILQIFVYNSY